MSEVFPFPSSDRHLPAPVRPPALELVDVPTCDLCDEPLPGRGRSFTMVSPRTAAPMVVCRTCRRAALSEGYRPGA